jgi:predicted cytidylate kinase
MKITIGGAPGSGKSTIARMLAKKLNYKFYSIGNIRRRMAEAKGLSIQEFNKLGEDTDTEVDSFQKKMGEQDDNFVLEGRLCYKFVPDSFKIYFNCDLKIAAERIFKDQRSSEKDMDSVNNAEAAIKERMENDRKRYKERYGIDYPEMDKFDIIIDTSNIPIDEVLNKVLKEIEAHKKE